jgi:hypothetical protein
VDIDAKPFCKALENTPHLTAVSGERQLIDLEKGQITEKKTAPDPEGHSFADIYTIMEKQI